MLRSLMRTNGRSFAKNLGAKFARPVAEHHDDFAMWDTKYSNWNDAKTGPKRCLLPQKSHPNPHFSPHPVKKIE